MRERRGQFAKIYAAMWDGTLGETWEAWTLFVYMLANCGPDGVLDKTPSAISRGSMLPIEVVRKGLAVLEAPDPSSRSEAEGGARIVRLDAHRDWGWRIVNFLKYREASEDPRLAANRRRRYRDAHATVGDAPGTVGDAPATVGDAPGLEAEAEAEESSTCSPIGEQSGSALAGQSLAAAPRRAPPRSSRQEEAQTAVFVDAGAAPAPVVALPTNRYGTIREEWPVMPAQEQEWTALFPAVDVPAQLRAMRAWLLANQTNRKTARGMPAFVVAWLSREQNRGRASPVPRAGARAAADEEYRASNAGTINDFGERRR